jgi:calcium-dependent protein kinase
VYEDSKYINLIMEFCKGGELFDKIVDMGCYSESDASVLMR